MSQARGRRGSNLTGHSRPKRWPEASRAHEKTVKKLCSLGTFFFFRLQPLHPAMRALAIQPEKLREKAAEQNKKRQRAQYDPPPNLLRPPWRDFGRFGPDLPALLLENRACEQTTQNGPEQQKHDKNVVRPGAPKLLRKAPTAGRRIASEHHHRPWPGSVSKCSK